jgi:dTMP kinase
MNFIFDKLLINDNLVVLEGCDAAGKGTITNLIKDYYESIGKTVKYIHFPMYGHNEFSLIISKFLQGEYGDINNVDPMFVANIYAMDRYMYREQLIKDLNDYDIVLMDRYVYSNLSFQGAKLYEKERDNIIEWIWDFEFNFLKLPYPNTIIYLDVPINDIENRLNRDRVGDDRNYLDGKKDIHEQDINFQSRVREIYLSLVDNPNYFVVNTYDDNSNILTPDQIFKKIRELI